MNKLFLGVFMLAISFSTTAYSIEVGVQFVIDQSVSNQSPTAAHERLNYYIISVNQYYANSGIDIQLKMKSHLYRNFYTHSNKGTPTLSVDILASMASQKNGFSGINNNAQYYGADFTVAVVEDYSFDVCGRAQYVAQSINQISNGTGNTVFRMSCGADTLAHELGHLMGLAHGDQVANCKGNPAHRVGLNAYSKGYTSLAVGAYFGGLNASGSCIVTNSGNSLKTIMVHNYVANVPLQFEFSNPNSFRNGAPLGTLSNANATKVLNDNKNLYTARKVPVVGSIQVTDPNLKQCLQQAQYNTVKVPSLQYLTCAYKNIHNISGVAQLSGLTSLDISYNNIVNIDPLKPVLQKGGYVDLFGNDYVLCNQLDQFSSQYPNKIRRPTKCFNAGALIAITSLLLL